MSGWSIQDIQASGMTSAISESSGQVHLPPTSRQATDRERARVSAPALPIVMQSSVTQTAEGNLVHVGKSLNDDSLSLSNVSRTSSSKASI